MVTNALARNPALQMSERGFQSSHSSCPPILELRKSRRARSTVPGMRLGKDHEEVGKESRNYESVMQEGRPGLVKEH